MKNRDVQLCGTAWLHPEIPFCTQTGLLLLKRTDNTNQQNYRGRFDRKYQNASTYIFSRKLSINTEYKAFGPSFHTLVVSVEDSGISFGGPVCLSWQSIDLQQVLFSQQSGLNLPLDLGLHLMRQGLFSVKFSLKSVHSIWTVVEWMPIS